MGAFVVGKQECVNHALIDNIRKLCFNWVDFFFDSVNANHNVSLLHNTVELTGKLKRDRKNKNTLARDRLIRNSLPRGLEKLHWSPFYKAQCKQKNKFTDIWKNFIDILKK